MIELNSVVNSIFCSHKDKVMDSISDEEYRFTRYGIDFSLAAVYSESEEALRDLRKYLRQTDKLIELSPHCSCICFDSTKIEGAIKVSQNIIKDFSVENSVKKIYIGVTGAGHDESNYNIVTRAFYTLNEAKKHNVSTVEDDYVLDRVI